MPTINRITSSFRDTSGFVFSCNDILYRQINPSYQKQYEFLMQSGLYNHLIEHKMLIAHSEIDLPLESEPAAYKVLKPIVVPFISYPYEWCFSQLKDAALLTLAIQKIALQHNMSLKDASAYNIQFKDGTPIFIDTLSFDLYQEGQPWIAYRQFCQHFLAPLALMSYRDIRLNKLLQNYIDGIPLDLASKLLPARSWLRFSLLSHLHLHARSQKYFSKQTVKTHYSNVSKNALLALVDNLENTVNNLSWSSPVTEWANYYNDPDNAHEMLDAKKCIIQKLVDKVRPKTVWDLGANNGFFSRVAGADASLVISCDYDPEAVESNYRQVIKNGEANILPMWIDLTNPSPSIGWNNKERDSFFDRGDGDLVMALALIHHLAIGNNISLPQLVSFFSELGKWLIIEFVPKNDHRVQQMLLSRTDIFENYNTDEFEAAFRQHYTIIEAIKVGATSRLIYLMERIQ